MKDGGTHIGPQAAEHAVDLETGAIIGVTVQDVDDGDPTASGETLIDTTERVEAVRPDAGDQGRGGQQGL